MQWPPTITPEISYGEITLIVIAIVFIIYVIYREYRKRST